MRVLVTIPHFFPEPGAESPGAAAPHGSLGRDPEPRVAALSASITSFHQLFGADQRIIEIASRTAHPANQASWLRFDLVVCTTGLDHLLPRLTVPPRAYDHVATHCPAPLLGYECHAVMRERLGHYDYYCYLEDDLILRDPWFFQKLVWFNEQVGDAPVLQPNRYEVCGLGFVPKAYVDGDLRPELTAPYQDIDEAPTLTARLMGASVAFRRARNPHSGCFFLNARQMEHWARRPDFLDRSAEFIGPLESAATLGLLRTFRIYKPAPENANFLEVEHFGTGFIGQLRLVVPEGMWA